MWKLFKRKNKNIDTSVIKNFNNALKIIEEFIALEEFEKAERSIVEIKNKENISFQEYIETVKEENKKVEIDKFRKNI
jgi:5-formyltetrahydrofolate cyclo-ligase